MNQPAAWLPDPLEWHQYRYWDGSRWTDHVSNAGVASQDSVQRGSNPGASAQAPAKQPTRSLVGNQLVELESIGSASRRVRLFAECLRRLASHPRVQPSQSGVPIGDGVGMEELVAVVKPVFADDRILARWVANRVAVAFIYHQYVEQGGGGTMQMMRVMGIDLVRGPDGLYNPAAFDAPGQRPLTEEEKSGIVGLYVSLQMRVNEYARFEVSDVGVLNVDPLFCISESMAYDYIAWAATLMLRDEVAAGLLAVPEPAGFEGPGWYTEPLFSKAERYWEDGWTDRCRAPGSATVSIVPLA